MSYLIQYLPRACAPVRKLRGARVDERVLLNQPGYHGDAYVYVFVENTSRRRFRDGFPEPRLRLEIADCSNRIRLEFDVETEGSRENSLFKIQTLIDSLQRFEAGLQAEADLRVAREHAPPPAAV